MKKLNLITSIVSGLGLVLSIIGLILLLVSNEPFLPEFSIDTLIVHPLVWTFISGVIFLSTLPQLLSNNEK